MNCRFAVSMVVIAAMLLVGGSAVAQVTSATLTGVVRDVSGASIPEAKITVTNIGTNISREARSDSAGNYTIPSLPPGEYRVEAEKAGFKKAVLTGVVLQVAQQARQNIEMAVGQVTERIEVTGTASAIETESPVVGGVIEETQVKTLPLKGRNFMELTTLTAGINTGNASTAKTFMNKDHAPSAAGSPATENNYQLDGANNKEGFFNTFEVSPSIDAVQEFKIQVGQYSAEYGAGGGAVINVVTKSGTNEVHGTLWEFVRNDVFDARNFFLRPQDTIAPLRQNQFGGAGGGPIIKNRTFIFANFDFTKIRRGLFRTAVAPTNAQKNGDLSAFGKPIFDVNSRDAQGNRAPYANAQIPRTQVDPVSSNLLKFYPEPNFPDPLRNFITSPSSIDDLNNYLGRVDHRLTDQHNLYFRYGVADRYIVTPGSFPAIGGQLLPQRFQNGVLGLTSTIRPTLLNEFRTSIGRTTNLRQGQNRGKPISVEAGLPYALSDDFNAGAPEGINLSRTTISGISEANPWFLVTTDFQWYDGITWIKGPHTWKFGTDVKRIRADANLATHVNGQYSFNGQYSDDGFADFLRGHVSNSLTAITPNQPGRFRRTMFAWYAQDEWKARSNLTVTLGVRYEFNSVPRELSGLTPSFDQALGGGVGGLLFPSQNTAAEPWFRANRPDLPVGKLDRETLFRNDRNNLGPRVGLAWRPFGTSRTVVRAGYGWYYSGAQLTNLVQNSVTGPPAQLWPTYVGSLTVPDVNWIGKVGQTAQEAFRAATFGVLTSPEQQWLDAYTQQWSMSVGHDLGKNFTVDLQYLGSKSTHVENSFDYNATLPDPAPLQPRLPNPKWGREFGFNSGASANYHALLVTAEKRLGKGLGFKASYTWGHATTKGGGRNTGGNIGQIQNPFNLSVERGNTVDDQRQRFVSLFIYELPIGKGKALGGTIGKAANLFLGGWSVAGITTFNTGFYDTPGVAGSNCNASTNNPCRADLIDYPYAPGFVSGVDSPRYLISAFDWPQKPTHPRQNPRFGSAGSRILLGNGVNNWDMSLLKNFNLTERFYLQFRWETFNSFNHPSFSSPVSGPESPSFGRTFSTQIDPRVNQFGLKLYF
ncbi:MAG: carboxypeptidase regulatory-like domain-containing protein [Bryobacteraceae bacterium]